jgi:TolB-like protein/Flp pilus assembly protein TadD
VPPRLRELTRRCLTKNVDERPRDIGDLRRELTAIAQELSAPSSAIGAASATPSLAVLYFENLAADPESEYFCAGITEDILTDLSKIKGLRVASRNAVLRYKGAPVDIAKVAAELGVRAVLEGSVRRAGDRVRITAQLINAADGFHLWAERYDRTLQDVFAVQEEIASSIAKALRVALSAKETAQLGADRPSDARAYDLYLKGRAAYYRRGVEAFREALRLFEEAIAVDAGYALAWAGVADCHGQLVQYDAAPDRAEALRLGLEAANRAIALNPNLAEGHKALGVVRSAEGDRAASMACYRKAVEVDPRHVPAITNLGVNAYWDADLAGAVRFFRRALEVDPQQAFALAWLALVMVQVGRLDEALACCARMRAMTDESFYVAITWEIRILALFARGDLEAASETVREALADGCAPAFMRPFEAMIALRSGRSEEARRLLPDPASTQNFSLAGLTVAAATAVRFGDLERAVGLITRTIIGDLAPVIVRLTHELHPLLDRPPFAPRRLEATLVWPLEAPMIDRARFVLFREVKIESGAPSASEIAGRE